MQHNSYACTNTIYICYVWLPSSLLPASLQHPVSFQHPYTILTASSQHQYSLNHQSFRTHRCIDHLYIFVHMCIGNQSCLIYICVCIHHSSSLITYMHWSSICMFGMSHKYMYSVFFDCLARSIMWVHCDTKGVYPLCIDMTGLYVLNCICRISTA